MSVVGLDGCRRGWIAIALDDDQQHPRSLRRTPRRPRRRIGRRARRRDRHPHRAAIDRPTASRRRRPRAPRPATQLGVLRTHPRRDHRNDLRRRQRDLQANHRHGISRQSFALAPKILEAEQWAASTTVPVWEVHPEVSFAVMLGHPAEHAKLTWCGLRERLEALQDAGIIIGDIGGAGAMAGADDVLDAAVAAWSASRLYRGDGISLPDPPEAAPDTTRPIAIWA